MPTETLCISTVGDRSLSGFDLLFSYWSNVMRMPIGTDFSFDLSSATFLSPSAIAFLGGLIRLVQFREGHVTVVWKPGTPVGDYLQKCGFSRTFGLGKAVEGDTSVAFKQHLTPNKDAIADAYLSGEWLGKDWIHLTNELRQRLVGVVWEVYANSFEHGQSPIGVFTCGQYFPNRRTLKLSIVDFGVGIPKNVRDFFSLESLSSSHALRWAFMSGNTTKRDDVNRGLGLGLLREFIGINKGSIQVFSHDGYAIFGSDKEEYSNRSAYFGGTMLYITLMCDDNLYCMKSEIDDVAVF